MLYDNFKEALAAGHVGEAIAAQCLSAIGYDVIDGSNDESYFSKDIDLLAGDMTIEVKADSRMNKTGNAVIETVSNVATGKKGWIYYTQATHIFFVDVNQKIVHCVRTAELKELYNRNKRNLKKVRTSQMDNGTYYKNGEIVLIPISLLETLEHYVKLQGE